MSHVAYVDIQIKDLGALKTACQKIGLEFKEGQKTHKWYGRWVDDYHKDDAAYHHGINPKDYGQCEHAIGVPDNAQAYEAGIVKRPDGKGYTLIYDFYGASGRALEALMGKGAARLKKQYAIEVARKAARKQGFRVQEKIGADGKTRLLCTR
jgi:hypothetical protein